MNLPNKITLLRVVMIPVFVVLAKLSAPWTNYAAAAVYFIACVTDAIDGNIARSRHLVTNFGKFMDPIADKLLVMSALVLLTVRGAMPDWACIIMLGREFLVSGFRLVAVESGKVIAAGILGKLKTICQMVATIVLLVIPGTLGQVLMYIALVLTVLSGFDYIYRNRDCIKDM